MSRKNSNRGPIEPSYEEPSDNQPSGAVSVYGAGDAMDDFPVLKAFQQYIDAEQAKSQKRTMMLCVFFVVILAAVVGVFVALLISVSSRNNALNDQLFKVLLDRQGQGQSPIVVQTSQPVPDNAGSIRAINESIETLQKQLVARRAEEAAQHAAAAVQAKQPAAPSQDALLAERRNQAENSRLQKLQRELDARQQELKAEAERLHQKEIDLQRRNLYPEYYAPKPPAPAAAAEPREAEDDLEAEADAAPVSRGNRPTVETRPARKPEAKKPAAVRYFDVDDYTEGVKPTRITESGAFRYFDDDDSDETEIKLDVGNTSGWDIPLD